MVEVHLLEHFQTGKYLSDGPEEHSFVASLADEVVVIAQCRLLQPDALPGGIEAYGKPVIQIDCVYEEPDYADAGAAEALISALPDVVQDLYGVIEVNRSEKFDRVKKDLFHR